jgi:hypothetical protein
MIVTRRLALLGTTSLATAGLVTLAGCASTSGVPAQILADAKGAINGLRKAASDISTLEPSILPPSGLAKIENPQGTGYLDLALALANGISTTTTAPAGATTLQTVEADVNLAMDDLAGVTPALAAAFPALEPAVLLIDAAVVLMPIVETFINSALPTSGNPAARIGLAKARAAARAPTIIGADGKPRPMTPSDARAILRVPTV